MNIVDVIPISRGIHKDSLSYFTPSDANVSVGAIVKVPLRGKTVNALVISSRPAQDIKIELKRSDFAFKKTTGVVSPHLLSKSFITAAEKSALYHVSTLGSMLFSLTSKIILETAKDLKTIETTKKETQRLHGLILQTNDEERLHQYKSLVREEFAKGKSVFLCMPTIGDIKRAEKILEKGIGEYSYIFHNNIKKKEFIKKWNSLTEETHPVFIIATGQFLSVPRQDIGTIIIERESSRSYKSITRPFTDIRQFAEVFSREIGARIVFGDTLLRSETVWRYRNDEFGEIMSPSLRVPTTASQKIIDMRKSQTPSTKFEPISTYLYDLISRSREKSERLFIFVSRRGLSPLTLCADCSTVVTCKNCQAPVVLHSKGEIRYFLCHHCGGKRDANEKCANCTGWRLRTLGVGAEMIAEEIKKNFPSHTLFRLDADSVKTNAEAISITKKFYETPGGVMIGTEMALMYLDEKIENVAIASIDSMFGLPDFRIREKIFSILVRLRSLAQKTFIIQTRNHKEMIFDYAEKGNLIDFYKQELEDRESFDFPPLTVLIKISLSGEKARVQKSMAELAELLKEYSINMYPAFTPMSKGVYTMHALIKIGRNRWVEQSLYEKLRSLPPAFAISVDPDNIL